jgi:hypothetical protein
MTENERIKERGKLFFRLTVEAVYILEGLKEKVGFTPFILNWIEAAKKETHTKKSHSAKVGKILRGRKG